MNLKKLSLDASKKVVLITALSAQADKLDANMRKIYDETAKQVAAADERIMLLPSQVSICKTALQNKPDDVDAQNMLLQLTLKRQKYASLQF